ncbi:hypothetical protein RQP46_000061 [Phenoliferia psychrophenolica]
MELHQFHHSGKVEQKPDEDEDDEPYLAALPLSDSPSRSPISSVPPETLGRILDFTFEAYGSNECYRNMTSAALVSKAWRDLALERFWRAVTVQTHQQANKLSKIRRQGAYSTKSVSILDRLSFQFSSHQVEKLLGTMHRVEQLHLSVPFKAKLSLIGIPLLSGLSKLYITELKNDDKLPPPLPASLISLSLGNFMECPLSLFALLGSSQQTIRTLVLESRSARAATPPLPAEPAEIPKLQTLRFDRVSIPIAVELFHRSPSLHTVEFIGAGRFAETQLERDALLPALADIPAQVEKLIIRGIHGKKHAQKCVEALSARLTQPWPNLRSLEVSLKEKDFRRAAGATLVKFRLLVEG